MKNKEEFETFVKNTRGERFLKRLDLWLRCDFLRFLTTITKERLN